MGNNNLARFLLTFFLGWIGSIIINHTSLKPEGYTSRTAAYFFLPMITCQMRTKNPTCSGSDFCI